jgi:8-oxo-dGTP diphosphatase
VDVVVCAAIVRQGRLLAARRTLPPQLAGRWELPGGKVESGELDEDALVREIREELGVGIAIRERVGGDWPLGDGVLRVWLVDLLGTEEPHPLEQHDLLKWLSPNELDDVSWLPADVAPARAALDQWLKRSRPVK